mmetsp:Transcript_101210/g.316300  ORF Transcript_101210/g.316300 Transcript_101210/m.316300 type:complete len:244 (+) Transcript_101210:440-1171(+)
MRNAAMLTKGPVTCNTRLKCATSGFPCKGHGSMPCRKCRVQAAGLQRAQLLRRRAAALLPRQGRMTAPPAPEDWSMAKELSSSMRTWEGSGTSPVIRRTSNSPSACTRKLTSLPPCLLATTSSEAAPCTKPLAPCVSVGCKVKCRGVWHRLQWWLGGPPAERLRSATPLKTAMLSRWSAVRSRLETKTLRPSVVTSAAAMPAELSPARKVLNGTEQPSRFTDQGSAAFSTWHSMIMLLSSSST